MLEIRMSLLLSVALTLGLAVQTEQTTATQGARAKQYSGRFVHFTLNGEELREISLPSGKVLHRMKFPIDGLGTESVPSGGVSDCGKFLVTALSKNHREYGIYAIDIANNTVRFLREGLWPKCGPNGELFFYSRVPGRQTSGLFVASMEHLSKPLLLVDGAYGLPYPIVFAGGRYMATYDPTLDRQILFEMRPEGIRRLKVGANCEPVFWRARTQELVCEDPDGILHSQELPDGQTRVLFDRKKEGLGAILHYWPNDDAVLAVAIRAEWFARERQDLIVFDLRERRTSTLIKDVRINAYSFAPLTSNPAGL